MFCRKNEQLEEPKPAKVNEVVRTVSRVSPEITYTKGKWEVYRAQGSTRWNITFNNCAENDTIVMHRVSVYYSNPKIPELTEEHMLDLREILNAITEIEKC